MSNWDGGSTWAWRKTRAGVLHRDGYRCKVGTPVCVGIATHVHHARGRSVTGDDPNYLVASCAPCNLRIGDPTKNADPPNKAVTSW